VCKKAVEFREFQGTDLGEVRALVDRTIDGCYTGIYCAEAVQFFKDWHHDQKILEHAQNGCTLVVEQNGRIIGTGTIIGDEIVRVFVDPTYQKHGFGKLIMWKLEEKALSNGMDVVRLDASIPSKKFYDLLDYVTLEETFLEVENDKRLDYCKMQKLLRESAMNIRQAAEKDMDVLVDLIRGSFREVAEKYELTVENCPKNPAFYTMDRIKSDFENGLQYFILEVDGRPCGCVALEKAKPDVCYLMRLGVLPAYRNNGYGRALVDCIFEQAKQIGAGRVEIAIIAKDIKRENWYKKLGFVEKGTREFDHLPFTVEFMYRELSGELE